MPEPRASLAATAVFVAMCCTGCVPPLDTCFVEGSPDILINDFLCPDPCYADEDGDGYGAGHGVEGLLELDEGEACPAEYVAVPGDCDDEDANAFPGNREVCDGLDNDCNGEADFDVEGEEEQGPDDSFVFSCTPPDVSIQIFVLGGSTVAGQPFDATTSDVQVAPGQDMSAVIRLRTVVPRGAETQIAGGAAYSWADSNDAAFFELWHPVAEEIDDGILDWEFETEVFEAPQKADGPDSSNAHYVTVGAGLSPDPQLVGALTDHDYCAGDGPGGVTCDPVWDAVEDLPGDDPDSDLADMDELDLAGCRQFGAARLPTLIDARQGANRCEVNQGGGDPPCIPFYGPRSVGCAFVKIVVEDPGE